MNKYVFVTPTINAMGGAQMYIRNKLMFLERMGWSVLIVSSEKSDNIIISELKIYKNDYFPELKYNCYEFSKARIKRVSKKIVSKINKQVDDRIIIESTSLQQATWSEHIAQTIRAKHIFFSLQESNVVTNVGFGRFLLFKHKRREIAGITPLSLSEMLSPFAHINDDQSYHLIASCSNVEEDVDCPILDEIEKRQFDSVIGCLSRLDKPFVIEGLKGVLDYCMTNPSQHFLLLFIGGAPSSCIKHILDITRRVKNVNVAITGYIYPVPTKLLDLCDVFYSSAGSAWVCRRSGIPTISYDCKDFKPIGVLGKTTMNCMCRSLQEPPVPIQSLLKKILIEKIFVKEGSNYNCNTPDFSEHMLFVNDSTNELDYYDVLSISLISIKEKVRSIILTLLGAKFYSLLGDLKSRRII